ncbi:2OG-Fe(II) oxygenase [Aquitalea magnusonii]|uniref:SM-20-related protein n=1 Tax=Aquitalea magnusonii TaxID=332411 RepID=A0A318J5E3_9NEIS|nr:2OG-Fe(II) oxygenase [Aquitalea magnusonii]PXX42910.1 SM-20-related protein [Aquitalea magnusonii]
MTQVTDLSPAKLDAIIDTLAEQGWVVDHTLFGAEDILRLQQCCLAQWNEGRFHEAAVGRADQQGRRSEIRSDSVLWLEPQDAEPAIAHYFATLDQVRHAVNQAFYLGLDDLESHFAVYPPGSFYKKHLDRFRDDDARALTAVLYLNEDWPADAGGQMRLYLDDECSRWLDVAPQAGTLVLFLSDRFWHEVLPASQQRLSVTGWFRRRPTGLAWSS